MAARIVITGGAGFLGTNLSHALLGRGDQVVVIDNLSSGRLANIEPLFGRRGFTFVEHDVSNQIWVPGRVDAVLHFASLASPGDYLSRPIQTIKVGSLGTHNTLGLAKAKGARYLLASTSEVYGDPDVHPQPEEYRGNVDPVGPRGVYDEAKRFSEAMAMAYHRVHGIGVHIARIFNTYGPYMRPDDGRVISNLIVQALRGEPLTVYGDGTQTRSFCYVDDLVAGLLALLDSNETGPVNLGNPAEFTIIELAELIADVLDIDITMVHEPLPVDDPRQRCPDIGLARRALGWEPTIELHDGLARTAGYFRDRLAELDADEVTGPVGSGG